MFDFFRLVPKKRSVKIKSKSGVIFNNPTGNKKYLFYIGTFIFVLAIGYFIYLYWPLAKSIVVYKSGGKIFSKTEIKQDITEIRVVKEEFWVKIPMIGASAEVKKNISPFNKKEYLPVLEEDLVAQAKGTGLPGQKEKAIYLFAHSTKQGIQMVRQNSVFYLLGELKTNDFVFIGYNGEVYKYKVYGQKIVGANDVEYLDYKEEGKEILILQTCWPIGTDWKRLLVFAERI
jgi:LPXTG-site transpeptidase (sortase) family protein